MAYKVAFTRESVKDMDKVRKAGLGKQAQKTKNILEENPYTPPYEKLTGNLAGRFSRRLNIQHRCVYIILKNENNETDENGKVYDGIVRILSMWTHYE